MSIVKLNVGGTHFQTTNATLGKLLESHKFFRDDSGAIFIDRDPLHFRSILNFLRDGHVVLPKCEEKRKELRNEAKFYKLDGLVKVCEEASAIRVLNSKTELFKFIMNSEKDVLAYFYPTTIGTQFAFPFGISEFRDYLKKWQGKYEVVFLQSESENGMGDWSFEVYKQKLPKKPRHIWNGQHNFFNDQDEILNKVEQQENEEDEEEDW